MCECTHTLKRVSDTTLHAFVCVWESCLTRMDDCGWVTHIWMTMSWHTHMNAYTYEWVRMKRPGTSPCVCVWVMSHMYECVCVNHVTYVWVCVCESCHICMSVCVWVMSHMYEWRVMAHIYECTHTWLSMNGKTLHASLCVCESCHTCMSDYESWCTYTNAHTWMNERRPCRPPCVWRYTPMNETQMCNVIHREACKVFSHSCNVIHRDVTRLPVCVWVMSHIYECLWVMVHMYECTHI